MGVTAVIDMRMFPYFGDPERVAMTRYGMSAIDVVVRLSEVADRGFERLRGAVTRLRIPEPAENVETEVLSFYAAALLAAASGSRWAISRLALAEADRAYRLLEGAEDSLTASVARLAGVRSFKYLGSRGYSEPIALVNLVPVSRMYPYSVSFVEYVAVGRRLLGDDAWRPVNLPVRGGTVYLDKHHAVRLVKEALNTFIEERILELGSQLDKSRLEALQPWVEKVQQVLAEKRKPRTRGGRIEVPKGVVVEEAFPPCMRDILERARRGEHLSHHERFAIATFLLNIGAEVDYVVDVFRNMPDFKEKMTRYQVEHLAGLRGSGKKYRTYSCEKMRTLGLCKTDCGTRSPIQAYYRALRGKSRARKSEEAEST